jgi:hypothetical protein
MIMNKPEDIKSSSFKTKEYLPGNTSYLSSDSLNMISQLANELYREDAKEASMNNRIVMKKTDFSVDSGNNGDSAYYFLPGYQSAPYTKQMSTPYYKPALDVYSIRKDFPILQRRINGKPLVWLDNAATTQTYCICNVTGAGFKLIGQAVISSFFKVYFFYHTTTSLPW